MLVIILISESSPFLKSVRNQLVHMYQTDSVVSLLNRTTVLVVVVVFCVFFLLLLWSEEK